MMVGLILPKVPSVQILGDIYDGSTVCDERGRSCQADCATDPGAELRAERDRFRYYAGGKDNEKAKFLEFQVGVSGQDVVTESLRRLCIWKEYGQDGIGLPWWSYVESFLNICDGQELFTNKAFINRAM
jgi:hypothetical protein